MGDAVEISVAQLGTGLQICDIEVFAIESTSQLAPNKKTIRFNRFNVSTSGSYLCGVAPSPANGYWISQTETEVTFHCLPDFRLFGPSSARCLQGVWSDNTPTCVPRGTRVYLEPLNN